MKKIRLLPSLLLLALCIGILGIGIYAASPASNTISGTVTVNAANASVSIAVYEDGVYNPASPPVTFGTGAISSDTTRTGSSTLSYGTVTLNGSNANSPSDVAPVTKVFVIKNNSTTKELGVYFWNRTDTDTIHAGEGWVNGSVPQQAAVTETKSDFLFGDYTTHYGASALNNILKVNYSTYQYLAPSQTVVMYVTFSLNTLSETDILNNETLNIYLNVEEYNATTLTRDANNGNYVTNEEYFIKIPTSVNSVPVFSYDFGLFTNSTVKHVVIPYISGVTAIPYGCFSYITQLKSVSIPSNITSIGSDAFAYSGLTSITIPSSVTDIGDAAFQSSSLSLIIIPNSVISMGVETLRYCSNLTSLTIPNSVLSIGRLSFNGCTSLISVTFENTTGWFTTGEMFASEGTPIDVTNPATNATNLKTDNSWGGKYVKKTVS